MRTKISFCGVVCGILFAATFSLRAQPIVVNTLAGLPSPGNNDGAHGSHFYWPSGIAADSSGNLFVADTENSTIRKIAANGMVSTFAGSPGNAGYINGNGTNAAFNHPQGIAVAANGVVYVADSLNNVIRKIDVNGTVSTFAGQQANSGSADGLGTNSRFNQPQNLAMDSSGNLFVADTMNHTIRKITAAGQVSTIAGLAENSGSADGTNSKARFYWPSGLATDSSGNIFVADRFNHTIRRVSPSGTNWVTTTIAGVAGVWGNADGTNNSARFYEPRSVAAFGTTLYVVDSGNQTLRKIDFSSGNFVVSTVAGLSGTAGNVDGTGTDARFYFPASIAIDNSGQLSIVDTGNNSVRVNRVIPPSLDVAFGANQATASWPIYKEGYLLEKADALITGTLWTPVTGVQSSNDQFYISVNLSDASTFFRLRKP